MIEFPPDVRFSVIIPAHNPDQERLRRTLFGLRAQTIPSADIEVLLVDNASTQFPSSEFFAAIGALNVSIIREPKLGLTHARKAGLHASQGEIVVFVDDDNVLAPNYLEETKFAFAHLPQVGALGGKSHPEFSLPITKDDWRREFFALLALRDLGNNELISQGFRSLGPSKNSYPVFAPIGAGMVLRREAMQSWLTGRSNVSDRRGDELTSAGDNDIIFTILQSGWEVAYIPTLQLTHLIPAPRLDATYLARLNHGIQKSWTQVLIIHEASPWPIIARWTVPLRKAKAWITYRAWSSPAAYIRWQGACGHFEGRAATR